MTSNELIFFVFLRKYTYVNRCEKNVVLKLFFVTRWRLRQLLRHPNPSGLPDFRFQIKQQQQVRSRSRKQQQQLRQLWRGRKAEQTDSSSSNIFQHWQLYFYQLWFRQQSWHLLRVVLPVFSLSTVWQLY